MNAHGGSSFSFTPDGVSLETACELRGVAPFKPIRYSSNLYRPDYSMKREVPLKFIAPLQGEARSVKLNKLFDVLSYDINHGTMGSLFDSKTQRRVICRCTSITIDSVHSCDIEGTINLELYSGWLKEFTIECAPERDTQTYADFPHDYPHDYPNEAGINIPVDWGRGLVTYEIQCIYPAQQATPTLTVNGTSFTPLGAIPHGHWAVWTTMQQPNSYGILDPNTNSFEPHNLSFISTYGDMPQITVEHYLTIDWTVGTRWTVKLQHEKGYLDE